MDENEAVAFPSDISALSLEALSDLEARATVEFDTLADDDDISDSGLQRLEELATGIEALRTARTERVTAANQRRERVAAQRQRMNTPSDTSAQPGTAAAADAPDEPSAGGGGTAGGARTRPRTSLADAQANAPRVPSPRATTELAITAAAATAGMSVGQPFTDVDQLVNAVTSHARGLVTSHGNPGFLTVAAINNDYDHVVHGERTSAADLERLLRTIRTPDAADALVAGGGWCAPSELKYDFFNIACEDGAVDLPTIGVQRGGIRFPVSPSLADVFTGSFTNATNPWLWTEADDILTVTGSPNKPCVRVICPSFSEARLECYGICLTAGNLTDSAYPEATRNHLALLMSAHYHATNQRYLSTMQSLSTFAGTVTGGATSTGDSIWSDLPTALGIAAQDVRTRFGMCDGDVLEAVVPRWVKDAMRSDVGRRSGVDPSAISDADIDAQVAAYRVRVQWVQDWQVRGSGQFGGSTPLLNWPATVNFMVYPAGTFVRGNGLTLDLGVVRDSVLNAENDHTAGWTEECHLIALIGHQSRMYTLPVCVGGKVGGVYTNCHAA